MEMAAEKPNGTEKNPNRCTYESYNSTAGLVTGCMQVSLGVASLVVVIIQIVMSLPFERYSIDLFFSLLNFLPTGIVGIKTVEKYACPVTAYISMSITCAVVACGMAATDIMGAVVSSCECRDNYLVDYCEDRARLKTAAVVTDSILASFAIIELIVAIVASCYACSAVCCKKKTYPGE